jgi:hypothetical protein
VSRGAKIALAILGVAVVAIMILVFVMVEHVDDATHAASKRVTPDQVERFDTIVVLRPGASAFVVSDIEDRMNRLDAVDEYAEVSNDSLAYLLWADDPANDILETVCANSSMRGYAVALAEPGSDARRRLATTLGDDATVRSWTREPPQTEIFMQVKATAEQTNRVARRLDADDRITAVRFLSHEDAYEEFRRLFADQPVLIDGEPDDGSGLPESFRLTLAEGVAAKTISDAYGTMPGVDTVNVPSTRTGLPTTEPLPVCGRDLP